MIGRPRQTVGERIERFWSLVATGDECWEWLGSVGHHNYGRFWNDGKEIKAHRFSWQLHNGAIPEGLWVLHRCDNPRCVRPDHLWLGTVLENTRDMLAKGRERPPYRGIERCLRGHELSGKNIYQTPKERERGWRQCRKCIAARTTAWRRKQRAEQTGAAL